MKATTVVFCLVALCLSTAGCGDQQAQNELSRLRAESDLLEANKALVLRAHKEVWSSGSLDVVEEIYSEEYIAHWANGAYVDARGVSSVIDCLTIVCS